jgi:hypothetical protein
MPMTYDDFKQLGMRLDMSRGKPAPEQLDLSRGRPAFCRVTASTAATMVTF